MLHANKTNYNMKHKYHLKIYILFCFYLFDVYFLKNASAIWLLPAFSTHTKRTFFDISQPDLINTNMNLGKEKKDSE